MASSELAAAAVEIGHAPLGLPKFSPRALRRLRGAAVGLLLPVGLAVLWEVAARTGLVSTKVLPAPSTVLAAILDLYRTGDLTAHFGATLWRVAAGFGLGAGSAILLAALAGANQRLREIVDPTLQGLRAVPSLAWVPLFILWFGIFETSKVLLIAVGAFFPVYLSLLAAIRGVDRKLIEVAQLYRFGKLRLIGRVLVPATLPELFTGLRGGLGLAWMFVIAAELMGASQGLGFLMLDGQMTGNTPQILGSLVLFAVIGKLSDAGLAALGHHLVAWADTAGNAGSLDA